MLTNKEFEMLAMLAQAKEPMSQRKMAEKLDCSLGSVNRLLKALTDRKLFAGKKITEAGLQELEPYRVKRAVFLAAGFDSQMVPVTLNTPKPLIRVNGVRMIDTLLDAVAAAEIPEVVIVRGYLGEQFDQLKYKYSHIQFVENPLFNECNNISSAMCVRFLLENAYVLDADLVLRNPELIRKYEYETNLLGIPVDRTDDWCVTEDKSGFVKSVTMGGVDGFREVGIFYLSQEDGAKMAQDLNDVYCSPGGKKRYWEQTPLIYKKEHYRVAVRRCSAQDVYEVRTFAELRQIDRAYGL